MSITIRLVSYGSPNYAHRQFFLNKTALLSGAATETSSWNPRRILSQGFSEHCPALSLSERGGGWWAWKPFIILKEIEKMKEGDWLFYCDVGRGYPFKTFDRPITPLIEAAISSGSACLPGINIPWMGPASQWTKRDAFVLTGSNLPHFHAAPQIQASFSLWQATARNRDLVRTWLNWCSRRQLISDDTNTEPHENLPDFQDHRHDQSLLTLLCLREGISGMNLCQQKPPFDEKSPADVSRFLGQTASTSRRLKAYQFAAKFAGILERFPRTLISRFKHTNQN